MICERVKVIKTNHWIINILGLNSQIAELISSCTNYTTTPPPPFNYSTMRMNIYLVKAIYSSVQFQYIDISENINSSGKLEQERNGDNILCSVTEYTLYIIFW